MRLRFFIGLLLLTASNTIHSQNLQIENIILNDKDSKVVYVGMVNKMLIKNGSKKPIIAKSSQAYVNVVDDTIFIQPNAPGAIDLVVSTKGHEQSVALQAKYLPEFKARLQS